MSYLFGALNVAWNMSDSSKTSSFSAAQKRVFKIIVVGDSCVGKTCLTYRFCEGKFPVKTEATIGVDFREKTLDVDGESIKVIFDHLSMVCIINSLYNIYISFSYGILRVRNVSVALWFTITIEMYMQWFLSMTSPVMHHLR